MLIAIDREVQNAKAGKPARIIAKMNALLEPEIIKALYVASGAGVKIDLIVRGVCALRPGIAGLSEKIRVRSIVGRFLEHSRIFYFRSGGENAIYLSSADWMDRNFFRRIEICFPVLEAKLKKRVLAEGLNVYLKDNQQAWEMDSEGNYHVRSAKGHRKLCAQEALLTELAAAK
jgi:polyphosphate kinase